MTDSRTLNLATKRHLIALGLTTMPDPIAIGSGGNIGPKSIGFAAEPDPICLGLVAELVQYHWV